MGLAVGVGAPQAARARDRIGRSAVAKMARRRLECGSLRMCVRSFRQELIEPQRHQEHKEHRGSEGLSVRHRPVDKSAGYVSKARLRGLGWRCIIDARCEEWLDKESWMKEILSAGWVRILLAVVVLAGSIVTFNFGLNEGLKPADYATKIGALDHYCDFCLFPEPPEPPGPFPVNKSA